MTSFETAPPLAVDLDGTLVNTDLLIESAFIMAREAPASLLKVPGWLCTGRATLKAEIARRADLRIADLPYNTRLVELLRSEKSRGRTLILATAANAKYAQQIAGHLGLFDAVLASSSEHNLAGKTKLKAIQAHLDGGDFDYVADHEADRVIWRAARKAVVVNARDKLVERVRGEAVIDQTFASEAAGLRVWARALRVHQWMKNALVFVPLIAAHHFLSADMIGMALLAFIAYSLLASSVYLLNDLVDLADDRRHPSKRERPFASGRLPLAHGLIAIPVLLVTAFVIAAFLPLFFLVVLAVYYVLTLLYSLGVKRLALLDVLTLAALYTLRITAGGAATGIPLSFWLLALSMSIFLSLAMAKRCTELLVMDEHSGDAPLGRGYVASDLAPLRSLGTAAGYTSVVILALYINSHDITNHYSHPARVWLLCPVVLYWISRIWLKTLRGQMHDDPIVFAARDPGSRICLMLGALIMIAAL